MIWFGWILWYINHCRTFNAKSSLYICIKYIWFVRLGLWHINRCRLFNAISPLYIYIKYIWFGLVGFMAYQPLKVIYGQIFQFLRGVQLVWIQFPSPRLVFITRQKNLVCPAIYLLMGRWNEILTFPMKINGKWNSICFVQDLNPDHWFHFRCR